MVQVEGHIRPYQIAVPDIALDDLRSRLRSARWPPSDLETGGWDYGVPLPYLQGLASYWLNGYDWRQQENLLNLFPQFMATIDGTDVHFIHARSPESEATPLLLAHGWPGSIVEFQRVIEPLRDPVSYGGDAGDAFDIVCPSMPGYGFSGVPADPGWSLNRIACAYADLMARLGYTRYGLHGGDWGSRVCRELAIIDSERVVGLHVTMLPSSPSGDPADLEGLSDRDIARLEARSRYRAELSGYLAIQSTRPHTLAYALGDSPIGQLAWIVEIFKHFADCQEVPEEAVDRDQLLSNVMIYWLTNTAGSSARLYYETAQEGSWDATQPVLTPTGVAVFPRETSPPIRRFAERTHNIVHWSEFDRGGHFAAMEEPDLLVSDLRSFFRMIRG